MSRLIKLDDALKETIHMELFGRDYPVVSVEVLKKLSYDVEDAEEADGLKMQCKELKALSEHLSMENASLKGQMQALVFALRCNGVSGETVPYEMM